MTHSLNRPIRIVAAFGIGAVAVLWSGEIPRNGSASLVSTADARIGRPMTPMSYAGVARRTTARAVGAGAAVGAAAVGTAAVARASCRQVVDAYGRIVTVC